MTWDEFKKLDLAGRGAEVWCPHRGGTLHGRLSRVCCDAPSSDPTFQLMASCRKKVAERMGVRGRNVPCAILEFSYLEGVQERRNTGCVLFFFPVVDEEAGCWYHGEHGAIALCGEVYVGLNYLTDNVFVLPLPRVSNENNGSVKASCPQAGEW